MNPAAIVTDRLAKSFGASPAVDDFSWIVPTGSITGLAGPNGAGKTTLLKMLLGITHPGSGTATVLGDDVVTASDQVRRNVAFVPEDKLLFDEMTVAEFLRFYASFFDSWNGRAADGFLDAWSIPRSITIKGLSKGMRAKLILAAALSRNPGVILLDEPTIDLDPASIEEVLSLVAQWVADGDHTVVMASHRLEEVERICDRVCIMRAGTRILDGDIDDVKEGWKAIEARLAQPLEDVASWDGVVAASVVGETALVTVNRRSDEITARLRDGGASGIAVADMNLREIYLTLTDHRKGRLDGVLENLV